MEQNLTAGRRGPFVIWPPLPPPVSHFPCPPFLSAQTDFTRLQSHIQHLHHCRESLSHHHPPSFGFAAWALPNSYCLPPWPWYTLWIYCIPGRQPSVTESLWLQCSLLSLSLWLRCQHLEGRWISAQSGGHHCMFDGLKKIYRIFKSCDKNIIRYVR